MPLVLPSKTRCPNVIRTVVSSKGIARNPMKHRTRVHVLPDASGKWAVKSAMLNGTALYPTKEAAVIAARELAPSRNIVVSTASGQILRPGRLKTSRQASDMRAAVLDAVKRRSRTTGT
jgi:hypothetical protein